MMMEQIIYSNDSIRIAIYAYTMYTVYFHSLEIKHHAFSNPVSVKRTYIEP